MKKSSSGGRRARRGEGRCPGTSVSYMRRGSCGRWRVPGAKRVPEGDTSWPLDSPGPDLALRLAPSRLSEASGPVRRPGPPVLSDPCTARPASDSGRGSPAPVSHRSFGCLEGLWGPLPWAGRRPPCAPSSPLAPSLESRTLRTSRSGCCQSASACGCVGGLGGGCPGVQPPGLVVQAAASDFRGAPVTPREASGARDVAKREHLAAPVRGQRARSVLAPHLHQRGRADPGAGGLTGPHPSSGPR